MDKVLINLGNVIEDLRMFQQNCSSEKEHDDYQRTIDMLNTIYDGLVLRGE